MSVVIEQRPYTDPDITRMVAEVQAHYVEIYGTPDEAPVDPAQFDLPHGLMLVGLLDGVAVAMGGWRLLDVRRDRTAELKRMYVSPAARRRGLARQLLAAVESSAREHGVRTLVLNTGTEQQAAIALYESSGYVPAAAFGHYAAGGEALFFTRSLTRTGCA